MVQTDLKCKYLLQLSKHKHGGIDHVLYIRVYTKNCSKPSYTVCSWQYTECNKSGLLDQAAKSLQQKRPLIIMNH